MKLRDYVLKGSFRRGVQEEGSLQEAYIRPRTRGSQVLCQVYKALLKSSLGNPTPVRTLEPS